MSHKENHHKTDCVT